MKFTFKTLKPTGKYKSFDSETHYIKYNGKDVGSIDDKHPHKIRLMIIKKDIMEDNNPNCTWKWITLVKQSDSIEEAKEFLNKNIVAIMNKFDIFISD